MSIRTKFTPLGSCKKFKHGEIIIFLDYKTAEEDLFYTIEKELPSGKYLLKLVGGGGGDGGAYQNGNWYSAGGSGAAIIAIIKLSKGKYRFTVGGKGKAGQLNGFRSTAGYASKIEQDNNNEWKILLSAEGGTNGIYAYQGDGKGGQPLINAPNIIIEEIFISEGIDGQIGGAYVGERTGGNSVYNGYGHGCGTYGSGGTGGLVELSAL